MKQLISLVATTFAACLLPASVYSQEVLNTEKYQSAELFSMKKGYDVSQRLQEIEAIAGKEVTVYQVSGKENKIKLTYTGIAEAAKAPQFSDKQRASLITVRTKSGDGMMRAYFPLTNNSHYRIYLTEKLKRN